jgi:hypothetical protein
MRSKDAGAVELGLGRKAMNDAGAGCRVAKEIAMRLFSDHNSALTALHYHATTHHPADPRVLGLDAGVDDADPDTFSCAAAPGPLGRDLMPGDGRDLRPVLRPRRPAKSRKFVLVHGFDGFSSAHLSVPDNGT